MCVHARNLTVPFLLVLESSRNGSRLSLFVFLSYCLHLFPFFFLCSFIHFHPAVSMMDDPKWFAFVRYHHCVHRFNKMNLRSFANFSAIFFVSIVCQNVFPDLLSCSPLLFWFCIFFSFQFAYHTNVSCIQIHA